MPSKASYNLLMGVSCQAKHAISCQAECMNKKYSQSIMQLITKDVKKKVWPMDQARFHRNKLRLKHVSIPAKSKEIRNLEQL